MTLIDSAPGAANARPGSERMIADFTSGGSDLRWYVVNDDVMGGRSEGDFEQADGKLRFTGNTDTNGGGFSSIRTRPVQLDLSKHDGIRLHVKGDGRRYTWRLTTAARWRSREVSYWAEFETRNGTWTTVDIPFASFIPRFRGNRLDGPALDPGQITGMGLMIYDRRDGPFELHLASVRAYEGDAPFTLREYRWKNRVLVVSAPSVDHKKMRALQDELASTPAEFADRDMVLLTLLDDTVSEIDGRVLTTGEVATARTEFGIRPGVFALRLIGKDGSVKLSGESDISMADIYALIDSMPMRQREKSRR